VNVVLASSRGCAARVGVYAADAVVLGILGVLNYLVFVHVVELTVLDVA
jgi:hypothetical protein